MNNGRRCFLLLLSVSNRPIKREAQLESESQVFASIVCKGSRRMMANRKGFSTVVFLAIVALLSCCCPASSFTFLPRVSRTKDAVIIDFAGVGYAPSYHGKTLYGQIANPAGFIPLPSFNPYPMAYRQQQQDSNRWSYSFGYYPADVPSSRQGGAAAATTTTTTTTTPAPAIQCGKGPTALPARSLIGERVAGAGATTAKANAWPFLVTLRKYDAAAGVYFCSGTLISDSKVLLAASCLEKMSTYEMSGVTVLVGVTSSTDVPMTRRISKVVLHGQYNAFNYANDVAILTLDAPVVLSRTVGPVCLAPASADPDQYVDQSAVIVGWATADSSASTALKQGTVAISSNSDCKADTNFGKFVTDANICIASTDKFVCAGDVGGPVLVLSSPGIWTQVGINSYTSSDCTKNSLQTRVSAFKVWIDQYRAN